MAHRDLKPENILCEHQDRVSLFFFIIIILLNYLFFLVLDKS